MARPSTSSPTASSSGEASTWTRASSDFARPRLPDRPIGGARGSWRSFWVTRSSKTTSPCSRSRFGTELRFLLRTLASSVVVEEVRAGSREGGVEHGELVLARVMHEPGTSERVCRRPARVQGREGVGREVHVAGPSRAQLPFATIDPEHEAAVVPRRETVCELDVHLGAHAGRVAATGDCAGGVDDPRHPVVGAYVLDDLFGQEQREYVEGHPEHRHHVDLRRMRPDVSPQRDRRAAVGGDELVDGDAKAQLPATLVLVVDDVAVDLP